MEHPTDFDPYLEWLGISATDRPLDHYRLLGLPHFESDLARIERHADQRMAMVRRFQTGPRSAWSQHILNELSSARGCLTQRETKITYDAALQGILSASMPASEIVSEILPPMVSGPSDPAQQVSDPTPQAVSASAAPSPPPSWEFDPAAPPPITPSLVVVRDLDDTSHSKSRTPTSKARNWIPALVALLVVTASIVFLAVWLSGKSGRPEPTSTSTKESTPPPSSSNRANESRSKTPDADSDPTVVRQEANGKLNFPVTLAQLHGESLQVEVQHDRSVVTGWKSSQEYLEWNFRLEKPGVFRVRVHYMATERMQGGRMMVSVGDSRKGCDVRESRDGEFHYDEFYLAVRRSGENRLTVRAESVPGPEFLVLERIEFLPR